MVTGSTNTTPAAPDADTDDANLYLLGGAAVVGTVAIGYVLYHAAKVALPVVIEHRAPHLREHLEAYRRAGTGEERARALLRGALAHGRRESSAVPLLAEWREFPGGVFTGYAYNVPGVHEGVLHEVRSVRRTNDYLVEADGARVWLGRRAGAPPPHRDRQPEREYHVDPDPTRLHALPARPARSGTIPMPTTRILGTRRTS